MPHQGDSYTTLYSRRYTNEWDVDKTNMVKVLVEGDIIIIIILSFMQKDINDI